MNYTYESINNQNGISVSKHPKILLKETDLIISRGLTLITMAKVKHPY